MQKSNLKIGPNGVVAKDDKHEKQTIEIVMQGENFHLRTSGFTTKSDILGALEFAKYKTMEE
jgi:hypothetical protein